MRRYNNPISFSDMHGESVLSLNLWLNPESCKRPGIDLSLMMCDQFFVSFQSTIGISVPVSMSGQFFLSLFVYNRRRYGTLSSSLLESIDTPYSGLLTLLHFLFSRRDFFLFLFFLVSICVGLHSLIFWLVVEQPRSKSLRLADWYLNQIG